MGYLCLIRNQKQNNKQLPQTKSVNMSTKKIISFICFFALVSVGFVACKKDAFSEKDAITAQTNLLQTKFNFDLAIKNIDLQIQRVSDSAKIAMIGLQFRADSSLERVKQSAAIAQLLQSYQNQRLLAMQADSLQRGIATYNDQIAKAKKLWDDSIALATQGLINPATLRRNYTIAITNISNSQPIAGATVSVIPYGTSTAVTATTNSSGVASFTDLLVDPASYFSVSATGFSSALIREASLSNLGSIPVSSGTGTISRQVRGTNPTVGIYNTASTRNTIRGSVLGDLDLTNGDVAEAVVGHLITFTTTQSIGLPAVVVTYQFPAVSDASGNYSLTVPDGNFVPSYLSNARVQQKMFVNSFTDEDAFTVAPRIATVDATIATSGIALSNGTGTGIYYTLPADSLTGKTVIAAVTSSQNTFITPGSGLFFNRNVGSVRTDSLGSFNFATANSLTLNNASGTHAVNNSILYSRKALYLPARPNDSLVMNLVSLVPNWIISQPALRAVVDGATGRISQVILARTAGLPFSGPTAGSGGVFNNAAMLTPTGRQVWTNLGMLTQNYLPSLANTIINANSVSTINANGGNSYFLPIELRTTVQRDKTPR